MTKNDSNVLDSLYAGLLLRRTPETVLAEISTLDVVEQLPDDIRAQVDEMAGYYRDRLGYWSMPEKYRRHPGLARAYQAAQSAMFAIIETIGGTVLAGADPTDPTSLYAFIDAANKVLGLSGAENPATHRPKARYVTTKHTDWWGQETEFRYRKGSRGRRGDSHGHANPRTKLTAEQRREALPGVSVRAYRRAVAAVGHLEQRTNVLAAERDREAAVAFGKSRLAYTITREEFVANPGTAAFVAYYVARRGLRTVFTNGEQDRPMDQIAEALLAVARADAGVRYDVIAKVLTRTSILNQLSEEEKGALLGVYYEQLAAFSRALRGAFDPGRDLTRMVARPGDDSSTWNAASRAFNQARTGWLNLIQALDLADVLEDWCPGKVPALVAADVAHWHETSGGSAHADTVVFAALPKPWDVILNGASCTAAQVRAACTQVGLNADESGWTQPYRQSELAQTGFTPDLVHGVAVASPLLAGLLRKNGAWSGRVEVAATV